MGGHTVQRRRRRAGLGRLGRPRLAGHPDREDGRRTARRGGVERRARARTASELGAVGWIDRTQFDHWGIPPHWTDADGQKRWSAGVRAFGKKLWEVVGERRNPRIVFEHPGEDTVPTSMFVCEQGGMVVICAGTTGYSSTVDLRYLWTRQKRFQGSHGTNDEQAYAYNDLVREGAIDPCLGRVMRFEEIGQAHQAMADNQHASGNTAILIGAREPGLGRK